jgi:hypothetical protein
MKFTKLHDDSIVRPQHIGGELKIVIHNVGVRSLFDI